MRVLHGNVNCGRTCVSEAIRIITQDMHIYNGTAELASVDEFGKVLAGKLTGKAARFVAEKLPQIAEGIRSLYYK